MAARWGMTIPLPGVPLAEHGDWIRELVDLGYTDLWTRETAEHDAFTPLAFAAAVSPVPRLGTAIASVFTRGPALLAMEAAALADAAPGRFVLGLGTSSEAMVSGWNDIPFEAPYTRLKHSLHFVRRALAGERIPEHRGFRLERPPEKAPPVYLGALQRRALRLAGREADGVLFALAGAADVPSLAEATGAPDAEKVMRVGVLPRPDRARNRDGLRGLVAAYLNVPGYAAMHADLGHGERLAPMQAAWRAGDRKAAAAAVPDEVVDALFVHGEPAACHEQLADFVAQGLDTPILSVMGHDGGPEGLRAVLRELAPTRVGLGR